MHSTEWVTQVAQRPPGMPKPLPGAGRQMSAVMAPCGQRSLQRAGRFLQLWQGRAPKGAETHLSSSCMSHRLCFSLVLRRTWENLIKRARRSLLTNDALITPASGPGRPVSD